jgi:hypothetical protein
MYSIWVFISKSISKTERVILNLLAKSKKAVEPDFPVLLLFFISSFHALHLVIRFADF